MKKTEGKCGGKTMAFWTLTLMERLGTWREMKGDCFDVGMACETYIEWRGGNLKGPNEEDVSVSSVCTP